jgi:hypothetical protein
MFSQKTLKPSRRRTLAADLMQRFGASHRQACAAPGISRSVYGYRSRARDSLPLMQRTWEITPTRVHYGYRRCTSCCGGKAGEITPNGCIGSTGPKGCRYGAADHAATNRRACVSLNSWYG